MKVWTLVGLFALAGCVNRAYLGLQTSLQVTPQSLPADGVTYATVAISIVSGGVPVPPTDTLTLIAPDPNAQIVQFGPADAYGWSYAHIRSSTPGTQTLTASVTNNGHVSVLPVTALVTFNSPTVAPGDPSPLLSWIDANPNVVSNDGQTSTLLTLHLLDGNGAPIPAMPVAYTSTGTANIFSDVAGTTDSNGISTTTLASTASETKTVTAHAGGMAVSTQVTFSSAGGSAVLSTLQANPNVLTADGVSITTLTFTLLDGAGLPLPDALVVWNSTGSNNTLLASSPNTDATGVAQATLTSTTAEFKNVTATSGAVHLTTGVTFLTGPVLANNCTFVANPNLLPADNSTTTTLTFTALDAHNNPVQGTPVTFSSSGSNNTLTPTTGVTNGLGVATATLTSSKAEAKSVTAVSGSINLAQTVTFLAGPPDAIASSMTANPTFTTADGASTITLTVTLVDSEGNPVPGQTVTFSSSGSSNNFTQPMGTTDAAGQVATGLSSTIAEPKTVIAAYTNGSVSTDVTFFAGSPATSMSALGASPTTVTADGSSTTQLTATIEDADGNPVSGQLVTLSASGLNNVLSPMSGTTDALGVFRATLASSTAEVKTVTANAGGATANAAVTFIAGAPSAITTTFAGNPTSVTADGTSHSTLTVTVEDAQGNPVAGQAVSVATTGSNNTLLPLSGTTDGAGVFTATLASTKAEPKNLTATIGSFNKTTSVTFVAGSPALTTTTFVANPNTVTADASATTTLTVTAFDAQGNPINNQSVSLGSTGSNNFFGSTMGTTNSAGVYTTTLASSTAEPKTITATLGALNVQATVTFVSGTATSASSTLSAFPTSATADGNATTQLTFTVKDAFGNPVANQAVTLSSSGTSNTFNPASGATNSSGQFLATLASTKAEVKTVTGTAGSATATTSVTFAPGAVSGTTTTLMANPNSVAADGSSVATLVTTATDAQGNPVPGQPVALSGTGTSNTFIPSSGSTNTSGTFTATLSSTLVQAETITALVAGSVSANANVVFTAPVVSPTNSTIVANPNSLVANGTATTSISVTVLNGGGLPVVGATVSMSATGTANVFSPVSGSTNGSGVFTTTLASTQAALKLVTAMVDGTALNTNVTFLPGPPASGTTTLVASPNTVTADGTSTSTLTVTVYDINGNLVPNQAVSLVTTGGNNTLTPASGNTDAAGLFTATLASTTAQTETVTATVNGFQKTATVVFVPGTVSGVTTTFVASPNSATADGTSTLTLTATVRDAEGNPVPNQTVSVSSTGSNNTFVPPSGSTNSVGVFTATMASTKAEPKAVKATIGTVNENANVVFVAGVVSATTSTIVLNPTSVTANGNTTAVTVTVEDAQGNPIANQNVTLNGNGVTNTFNPTTGPTNSNGVFTATLSSTVAQVETITATVAGVNLHAAMTFTAGAANSGTSSFIAAPTTLVANGVLTSGLTVTVRDAFGNLVPNQAVSFSSSGTANTLSPTSGTTNGSGVFTATLSSTMAEVKSVTATIGTFTKNASITFTAGAPYGTTTTLTASPTSLTADGTSLSTLRVTVKDQYGNPVGQQGVTFTSSGSNNTFSSSSGTTDGNGLLTTTLASTTAETKSVTAKIASLQPTASITFVAGAPNSGMSTMTAVPGIVTANNANTTTVTVTVKDAFGNLVPNQTVSIGADGTSNTWGSTSGPTNGSGTWTTTLASPLAQTENITATIGTVTEITSITFVAGAPASGTSSLSASLTSLTADGATPTTLQITVKDAQSNPVNGQSVTFSSGAPGNVFSASTCNTNPSGLCSVTLTSTVAEPVTVTAAFAGLNKTANVTFVSGPATSATSSLTASPNSLADNGVAATTLQVTVKDAQSNAVNAQAVTFTNLGAGYTFSAPTCSTNTSGQCSVTLTSTVAGAVTVTANFAAVTKNAAVSFITGAANSGTSTLTANPNALADNGIAASTLQVTVDDATGNAVNAQVVTFSTTASNYSLSATTCTTLASGICSVTLKSTTAQSANVIATFAGVTKTAAVTFLTGSPNSVTSSLTATPTTVAYNGSNGNITLQVNVDDSTGNPIATQAVTFTSTGSGYTFTPSTCTTTATGLCSVVLTSSSAQTLNITASFASASATTSVTFTATFTTSTSMALETSAATAQCMTLPNSNNQPGATMNTAPCGFHANQIFSYGNDDTLRVMGYCVEVAGAVYSPNTQLNLVQCSGAPEQTWTFNGNALQSAGNSNYCMDAGTGAGSTMVINACTSSLGQHWIFHGVSSWYSIVNPATNVALNLPGQNFSPGTVLTGNRYNVTISQFFYLTPQNTLQFGQGGSGGIAGTSYCVEVPSGNYVSGQSLDIFACNGAANQEWVEVGNTLRPIANQNLCMDMGDVTSPTPVPIKTCTGSPNQVIVMQPVSQYYQFVDKANVSVCMNIAGAAAAGTAINNATCAGSWSQDIYEKASSDVASVNLSFPNTGYDFDGGPSPMTANTNITLQQASTDPCSILWIPTPVGDAYAYVSEQVQSPNLVLDAHSAIVGSPIIVNTYTGSSSQLFYKWPRPLEWTLSSAPGQCITAAATPPVPGTPVLIAPCTGAPSQQWTWIPYTTFINGGLCLDMVGQVATAGVAMQLANCDYSDRQRWNAAGGGNISTTIRLGPRSNSGLQLDTNNTTATGSPLMLETASSSAYQKFVMY